MKKLLMAAAALMLLMMSAAVLSACSSITYSFICDCVEYGDWKYGIRDKCIGTYYINNIIAKQCESSDNGYAGQEG